METEAQELALASESAAGAAVDRQPAGAEFPDELLEALQGTVAGQSADSDSEPDPAGKPTPKATLNSLAEAAGGEDQLYKMTVALPDELGTATIEQLKDEATAYRQGQGQQQTFETERTEFANQKLKYMQELQQAVQAIPTQYLTDEARAQVATFFEQQQVQQDRVLFEVIPQWRDQAVREADTDAMSAFLSSQYGAPTEVLNQPAPAWVRKLIYDHWKLNTRLKEVANKRKAPKSAGSGRNVSVAASDRKARAVASAKAGGNKIDSILALLQD